MRCAEQAKELEVQLIQMREEHSRKEAVSVQHCTKLEAALKGTEMQLLAVSDQLAQRTILYEAQERRWKSSLSGQTALSNERNHELVDLKARFEQLQQQYYQMDCDRTEALLETREIRNALSVFETDRAEERIRLERAEEELSIAVHFTHELQQQLDRVKGTDLTVLEQSMAAENENIRDQFDDRENELLRQLEKARESLLEEKQHREALVDEMQSLHQKNHYFAALLQQLRCGSNGDQAPSNRSLHSFENFSDVEEEGGDGSLTYSDALIETSTSGRPRECTDGCQNPVDETSRGPHRTTIGRSAEEASSTSSASHRDPFVIKSGQVVGLNEEFLTGI